MSNISTEALKNLVNSAQKEDYTKHIQKGDTPLWKYWEDFVFRYLRVGHSTCTVKNTRDALKMSMHKLKIYSIEEYNASTFLEDKLFDLKNEMGWQAVTYNTYLKNINTYFIWLHKMKYISENHVSLVSKCKALMKEQHVQQPEEVEKIVCQICTRRQTKIERSRNASFIHLLRLTGARPSELIDIKRSDLRYQKNGSIKLVIQGKKQKGKPRYYTLPAHAIQAIEDYLGILEKMNNRNCLEYLFVSSRKDRRWTISGMRKLFNNLGKELNFRITAYGFRRYVCTRLYKEGYDIHKIKDYMGHTKISTTSLYIERCCALTDGGMDILKQGY